MADLYECDCCGAMVPREQIATVTAYGIETAACAACRGEEPEPWPVETAARICPVFRRITGHG